MPKRTKPKKPRPDFPLFPHATGRWAKKVRGKLRYFGKIEGDQDGQKALARWLEEKDAWLAGRTPKAKTAGLTVAALCNTFLTHKSALVESGELAAETFARHITGCQRLTAFFGRDRLVDDLGPEDFQAFRAKTAAGWGPHHLTVEISRVRGIFRYALETGLIHKAVVFGPGFRRPSAKTMRLHRAKAGPRLFSPAEIHKLIKAADANMRGMILLGLNGGLGCADLAAMPVGALDLERGWLDYPRVKTGIPRRIPLWAETVAAIRTVLADRPSPVDEAHSHLVFLDAKGEPYHGLRVGFKVTDVFSRLRRVLKAKPARCFYDLRRTFQTVADEVRDPVAVSSIMGHAAAGSDMSAVYRQRVDDERLRRVVDHVRTWLFGSEESK